MDSSSIVALASVIVTGLVSGISLYLTYKDRASGHRRMVFSKQMEMSAGVLEALANLVIVLLTELEREKDPLGEEAKRKVLEKTEKGYQEFLARHYKGMMFISDDLNNAASNFEMTYRALLGLSTSSEFAHEIAKQAEKDSTKLVLDLYSQVVFAARNTARVGATSKEVAEMLGRPIRYFRRTGEDAWH